MKRMKILKVLALIVFVLPFAFILSACGDNDNLKTFENITFANQTIDYDGQINLPCADLKFRNVRKPNYVRFGARGNCSLRDF